MIHELGRWDRCRSGTIGTVSSEIRRSSDRFVDRAAGRMTHHAFSFGASYDPDWVGFGPMMCHDDHLLGTGQGFEEHPHEGLDIVTWVVSGAVRHEDSDGNVAELAAGECGVLAAGSGVRHSELATGAGPARFVQVWLRPDNPTSAPSHARAALDPAPGAGLVPVIGEGAPLQVDVAGASLRVARLEAGETLTLPAAPRLHVYVASGALLRFSLARPLQSGDAICLLDEPDHDVTAGVPTELLVWSFAG